MSMRSDLWYIHGLEYNLDAFKSVHPGGPYILDQCRGIDASHLFDMYHAMASRPICIPKALATGVVLHATSEPQPALERMKVRTKAYFKDNKISHKAPVFLSAWYAAWTFLLFFSLYRWAIYGQSAWAIGMGMGMWWCSTDVLHNGMHHSLTRSWRFNELAARIVGLGHCDIVAWTKQHNVQHHAYTNHEHDCDLYHFVHDFGSLIGMRVSEHSHRPVFLGSAWFGLLLIPFTSLAPRWIMPLELLFGSKVVGQPTAPLTAREKRDLVIAYVSELVLLGVVAYAHGVIHTALPFLLHGILYYAFSQVSHINTASQQLSGEWAVKQVQSCRGDYAYDSHIAALISIGLNLQCVHHVFPTVHWWHYKDLWRILHEEAGEPCDSQSYLSSLQHHMAHLREMN